MQYYTFRQTNSGGSFDGRKYIVIKAPSAEAANEFAERHTPIYFDYEYEIDCSCCGTRWYALPEHEEGDDVPSRYGEPDFVDHSDYVGLQHVSAEDWIIYEDYNDPDNFRTGITVDNHSGWNDAFFKLNDLMKAPEGSTIYGVIRGLYGFNKTIVDLDELIAQGIGYQEYYNWDEAVVDIVLKHKIDEARQEKKASKKDKRR